MRTSRDTEAHRTFIRNELAAGRLRQGWGWQLEQDLRLIQKRVDDENVGWDNLTDNEKLAWGNWRLLGEQSSLPSKAMKDGDIVLVPNMPEDGLFTLCRLCGLYDFSYADPAEYGASHPDFGHVRPVRVLTPGGISNTNESVSGGLRTSLKTQCRLWSIGLHRSSLANLLVQIDAGLGHKLRIGSDHSTRAQKAVAKDLQTTLSDLGKKIAPKLHSTLQSAEWEPVIRDALIPLLRKVDVIHTGGPAEKGADLEIHLPNPFFPSEPWVVAVQVKDYDQTIGAEVADQLEQAITARQGLDSLGAGRLVAVVLASTRAEPSAALTARMTELSTKYCISISCIHGDNLMRVIARGLFMAFPDAN